MRGPWAEWPPKDVVRYPRYRFPAASISHAVWPYYRFTLSFHDVEDLLAHRDIAVAYESIRHWCENLRPRVLEASS